MKAIALDIIEKNVLQMLENGLSEKLTYHNIAHTQYVLKQTEIIAAHENIIEYELILLKIAALYHDIGFLNTYKNHELESCNIAKTNLPSYNLTSDEIIKICGMIMATKIPQQPKNKLEMIIADADLEYLGTTNYSAAALGLFNEFKYYGNQLSDKDWLQIQIQFLENHSYFTSYCKLHKNPIKTANLNKLRKMSARF